MKTPYLPMFDIRDQGMIRGVPTATYTQLCGTGFEDASLTLVEEVTNLLKDRPQDPCYLSALDGLAPALQAKATHARLAAIPELADPGTDAGELRKRLVELTGIRGKKQLHVRREAQAQAETAAEEALEAVRGSLLKSFSAAPDRIRQAVDEVLTVVKGLSFPPADPEPFLRFQRTLKAFDHVEAHRTSLPATTVDYATAELLNLARYAYESALAAIAAELSGDALRRGVQKLQGFLEELAGRGTEFSQKLTGLLTQIEDYRKAAARDRHVSRASVVLPLEGPDRAQVLAGMLARHRCPDLAALAALILERFEMVLRERVPQHCPWLDPATVPFAEMIRCLPSDQATSAFTQVARDCVGSGSTLYEAMDQFGQQRLADWLYHRAEPACQLESAIEAFNISPRSLAIVRLPPPVGPRDHGLREGLIAAFRKIDPTCQITEGAVTDRGVVVFRLLIGFPVGVLPNRAFVERYVESAKTGHPMHLVGLLDDAPLGTVRPKYQTLVQSPSPTQEDNHHAS